MASDYMTNWVRARTAAGAGKVFSPEQALVNNPFYVGPPGVPVPQWVTDALGRKGRTPAFPNPAAVPPDVAVNPRPSFFPDEQQLSAAAGAPPAGAVPTSKVANVPTDPNLQGVYQTGSSGGITDYEQMRKALEDALRVYNQEPWNASGWGAPAQVPQNRTLAEVVAQQKDAPIERLPIRGPMPPIGSSGNQPARPVNPLHDWYRNQQIGEAVNRARQQVGPQAPDTQPTRGAVPAPGVRGVPEPGKPKPVTMRQAFTQAQQRLSNRTPFRSRLG